MAQLSLWFNRKDSPELIKTEFYRTKHEQPIIGVRGKSAGAYRNAVSFQWSQAVKALCLLVIRHKEDPEAARLSGEKGSLAASLDYAISKKPLWLVDMFGCCSKGVAFSNKLFVRTNPERKNGRKVTVAVKSVKLPATNIRIFRGDTEITDREQLLRFADAIDSKPKRSTRPYINIILPANGHTKTAGHCKPHKLGKEKFKSLLKNSIQKEVVRGLRYTDIFNRRKTIKSVNTILEEDLRWANFPKDLKISGHIESNLNTSENLGISSHNGFCRTHLRQEKPFSVCVSPAQIQSISILYYLKHIKKYNISVNFDFAHTFELLKRFESSFYKELPDACITSLVSSRKFFSSPLNREYELFMIMPKVTHKIVAPKPGNKKVNFSEGNFILEVDSYGTTHLMLERLKQKGEINKKKVSIDQVESNEIPHLLNDADSKVRAVQWFPFYDFNQWIKGCETFDLFDSNSSFVSAVLFIKRSIKKDTLQARALQVAIRDAWLELRTGGTSLNQVSNIVSNDEKYLKMITRLGGIKSFENFVQVA